MEVGHAFCHVLFTINFPGTRGMFVSRILFCPNRWSRSQVNLYTLLLRSAQTIEKWGRRLFRGSRLFRELLYITLDDSAVNGGAWRIDVIRRKLCVGISSLQRSTNLQVAFQISKNVSLYENLAVFLPRAEHSHHTTLY